MSIDLWIGPSVTYVKTDIKFECGQCSDPNNFTFILTHRRTVLKFGVCSAVRRSYPSREKSARFLTADVEQLIRESTAEKEHLSAAQREKQKQISAADASIKKSSQVSLIFIPTLLNIVTYAGGSQCMGRVISGIFVCGSVRVCLATL